MMRQRVEIKMTFSADLDPVKGWGDNPNDWATMLEQRVGASVGGPYNMKLTITDINCRASVIRKDVNDPETIR